MAWLRLRPCVMKIRAKRSQFGPRCPEVGAYGQARGPRPETDCARRSQFAGAVSGPGWVDCAKRTQSAAHKPAGPSLTMPPVTGQRCKTKPIPRRRRVGRGLGNGGPWDAVQTKPISRQARQGPGSPLRPSTLRSPALLALLVFQGRVRYAQAGSSYCDPMGFLM